MIAFDLFHKKPHNILSKGSRKKLTNKYLYVFITNYQKKNQITGTQKFDVEDQFGTSELSHCLAFGTGTGRMCMNLYCDNAGNTKTGKTANKILYIYDIRLTSSKYIFYDELCICTNL